MRKCIILIISVLCFAACFKSVKVDGSKTAEGTVSGTVEVENK